MSASDSPQAAIRFCPLERDRVPSVELDVLLDANHPVRAIDAVVRQLDFTPLEANIRARVGRPGAPAFDPRVLFALWLFATIEGICSGRVLAERCRTDLPFLWLCGQNPPNYHTLTDFYSRNDAFLKQQFQAVLSILLEMELVTLQQVTLDGRKIPANASKESMHREATLTRHEQEAADHLAALEAQRAEWNREATQREAAQLRAAEDRQRRLAQALNVVKVRQQEREDSMRQGMAPPSEVRTSETDADARKMKLADGGYRPAYNTQTVMDAGSGLIVTVEVTDQAADNGLLGPMMAKVEAETGRKPAAVLADAGFASSVDVERLEKQQTKVYMPPKNEAKEKKAGTDPYAQKRRDTPELAAWRGRLGTEDGRAIYKKRAPVAEGVHGQQSNRGWKKYRLRGLLKVRLEAWWQALAHNLCVLMSKNWLERLRVRLAAS